ncbi:MAG: aldose 1-epimerase family protein, partial [Bacteroidota bacterium]
MTDHIENEYLQVSVLRKGVELSGIKSKKTGIEYMWQANPDIWGSHAPVLFPIIGALKEDQYSFEGKIYEGLPKHGFIRRNEKLELIEEEANRLRYELNYSEDSLKIYPFKFGFSIEYRLEGNKIHVDHEIINQGQEEMLFSLGGHPAFNCPWRDGAEYEEYYLEFEQEENDHTWVLSDRGLIDKPGAQLLDNSNTLPLSKHLFDADALIFKNLTSRTVHLKSSKHSEILSMHFPNFPYLGIWAKPQAPYICIEPWMGIADSETSSGKLEEKEGIMKLAPQSGFE